MLASRLRSVATNTGGGNLLLLVIAAAVIGGTSLFGGVGRVVCALYGALVITSIENGMNLLGLSSGPEVRDHRPRPARCGADRRVREAAARRSRHGVGSAAVRVARALTAGAALAVVLTLAACGSSEQADEPSVLAQPRASGATQLVDVADEVGIDFRQGAFRWDTAPDVVAMQGTGLCWLDYDGDGLLDLFAVNSYAVVEIARWRREGGLPETALYRNDGGRFEDVSEDAGANFAVRGTGCVAGDLDTDGDTDLYVTTATEQLLLWNDGDGHFTEGARDAGVGSVRLAQRRGYRRRERRRPARPRRGGLRRPVEPRARRSGRVSRDRARCPRPAVPERGRPDLPRGRRRSRARGREVRPRPRRRAHGRRPRRRPGHLPRERHRAGSPLQERRLARWGGGRSCAPRLPPGGSRGPGERGRPRGRHGRRERRLRRRCRAPISS